MCFLKKQCKKQCLSLKTKCSKPRKTRVIEKNNTKLFEFCSHQANACEWTFSSACRWKGVCELQKHVKHECFEASAFPPSGRGKRLVWQTGTLKISRFVRVFVCTITKTIVFYVLFWTLAFYEVLSIATAFPSTGRAKRQQPKSVEREQNSNKNVFFWLMTSFLLTGRAKRQSRCSLIFFVRMQKLERKACFSKREIGPKRWQTTFPTCRREERGL